MAQRALASAAWPLLAFLAFTALCLVVYRPALHGPFVSDDIGYLIANPYTASLSAENVAAIFDPRGEAAVMANYAPLHLLLHALERQIFADATLGYHLVNVCLHAAATTLLALLWIGSGVPRAAALVGAALFAGHPANVEAVAWISQLKSCASLALGLAALLAWGRRPGLSTLLFALALLVKASAAAVLPMAAALSWARGAEAREWRWLGLWSGLLVLYAIPELAAQARGGAVEVEAYADPWVQLRSAAAIGARYLVMAASGYGVSAFQEPGPVRSWWDPWWLGALPAAALLGWRLCHALSQRREEAAWWIGAAASFVPVSQIVPFPQPVADRYLYFMLPGLIGGALLAWPDARRRLALPARAGGVVTALALALALVFAGQARQRARLWTNPTLLYVDAARSYPDGATAHYLRARGAAAEGDVPTAVAALRLAAERGIDSWSAVRDDPAFAGIRRDPAFVEVLREIAGRWLDTASRRGYSTRAELRAVARAHRVRGEHVQARAALEAALGRGGPGEAQLREELEALDAWIRAGESPEEAGDRESGP